jgi:formylglycine-generating enzyme
MILAAAVVLTTSFVQGQTHAPWPTDWNNWSDPALLVTVVNSGNAADSTGFGSVGYNYNIGKYEVTAGQYTTFLNAVAKTDPYGLYNTSMDMANYAYGCNIKRLGSDGSYEYSVAVDWANRPVNVVSFWDAARFTNWLNNGQGNGDTETGAYTLNGYNGSDGREILRNPGAKWFLPSEDEWYKAAYYKAGSTNAGYWDYPTSSDTPPGRDMADASGNNANYSNNGYLIGSPYYRTPVGEFQLSDSVYGTFDQGGNAWEWNETVVSTDVASSSRGQRGGSITYYTDCLLASARYDGSPTFENAAALGFRVASVFEFFLGDANKDGTVNVADLTLLLNNYNKTGMVWANGDFNYDGTVNVADLTALLDNYNQTSGTVAGTAVPEPSSITMLGIAGILLCWWRKRS